MIKKVVIQDKIYLISNEEKYSIQEELVFEVRQEQGYNFIAGKWDDILGQPVRSIWKIVGISIKS